MRFTLSNFLLSLALFPLLIQGAPLPKGNKIHSTGPVVLPVSNSGEDGGKSRWRVGPKIAQRHPQSVGTAVGGDVGSAVSGSLGALGTGLAKGLTAIGDGIGGVVGGVADALGGPIGV